jgi:hypothetical protein
VADVPSGPDMDSTPHYANKKMCLINLCDRLDQDNSELNG